MRRAGRFALMTLLLCIAGTMDGRAQLTVNSRYDDTFRKYAKRYFGPAFDWRVFKAQSMTESRLDPNAVSWVGARGLMQLMPSTYESIRSKNREFGPISNPEWNIAAGIYYNRQLWRQWESGAAKTDRKDFMFGSYNAGRATILRAQRVALGKSLNEQLWLSIQNVAPDVPGWRHRETLDYVQRIQFSLEKMDNKGRIMKK